MDNALDPNLMTAEERLREIGEIVATGLLRLRAKQVVENGHCRETFLDFPASQSVHARNRRRREKAWKAVC